MKKRIFWVFVVTISHLVEAGLPASFNDVIALVVVTMRAWQARGEANRDRNHRNRPDRVVVTEPSESTVTELMKSK